MLQTLLESFAIPAGHCRMADHQRDPRVQIKVSAEDASNALSICEIAIPLHVGPPVHLHLFDDEFFYVLEGDFRFLIDGREVFATEGSSLYSPRRVAHTFQNVGSGVGRLLTVSAPGGLDRFFAEFSAANPPGEPVDPVAYLKLYERHNIVFIAPPLELGKPASSLNLDSKRPSFMVPWGESRLKNEPGLLVSVGDTHGRFSIHETLLAPGHSRAMELEHDQFLYVLEGPIEVQLDGETIRATTGTSLYARKGTQITTNNSTRFPARVLLLKT